MSECLASFFTAILRHGYMPKCLRDSVLVPILKSGKNESLSDSYRPISLASTFSKLLENIILVKYSPLFSSSFLQFGFKPGSSTFLCTGLVKNIVSRYIFNDSTVLGYFWMPRKRSTWLITVNYFLSCYKRVCLLQLFGFW